MRPAEINRRAYLRGIEDARDGKSYADCPPANVACVEACGKLGCK